VAAGALNLDEIAGAELGDAGAVEGRTPVCPYGRSRRNVTSRPGREACGSTFAVMRAPHTVDARSPSLGKRRNGRPSPRWRFSCAALASKAIAPNAAVAAIPALQSARNVQSARVGPTLYASPAQKPA